MVVICQDFIRRTSIDLIKGNSFIHTNKKIRYPAETMTDADNTDNLVLFENILGQDESLFQSLQQAAGGIRFCVNANKTESMCFEQEGAITLGGKSLKLVDDFKYLDSNI